MSITYITKTSKTMRAVLFLTILAIHSIQKLDAQNSPKDNTPTTEQIVEKLDQKLNLTDEQEKEITVILSDFFKNNQSRAERIMSVRKVKKKITSILSDKQKELFAKNKKAP